MTALPAARVLLVDDEEDFRKLVHEELAESGYHVVSVGGGTEAVEVAREQDFDAAVLDLKMPDMDGVALLSALKEIDSSIEVIILTAHATIDTAIKAMKLGALDYLSKPVRLSELQVTLTKAIEVSRLRREAQRLRVGMHYQQGFQEIIGQSKAIRTVFEHIEKVASSEVAVLVEGESGTGKELVAQAIHQRSRRAEHPFVVLNCAALTESLLESDLFGHEKGAFTGAAARKTGLVEVADGGTLFVDEVSEMSLGSQSRFLRVLETGEVRPVGSTRSREVDCRVVAATNKHLDHEVRDGRFRQDLFYRLNVYRIGLPPLRQRRSDIPLLVDHFLRRKRNLRELTYDITASAVQAMQDYSWPGNVRELANVIERAVIATQGEVIRPEHLALTSRDVSYSADSGDSLAPLATVERAHIERVLEEVGGNKSRAARVLGISVRNLYRKLGR